MQGSVQGLSQPTLSTFPVGGNLSTPRKSTTFGRVLTFFSHTMCQESAAKIESTISEAKGDCVADGRKAIMEESFHPQNNCHIGYEM